MTTDSATFTRLRAGFLFLAAAVCFAQPAEVRSPRGDIVVSVEAGARSLVWRASYKGKPLLLDARLGLTLYSGVYKSLGHSTARHEGTWKPAYGERAVIPDVYNELTARFEDKAAPFRPLEVMVRAYDGGFAFRYRIPGSGPFLYYSESSEFRFPAGTRAWEEYGTEGEYRKVPVETVAAGCERPLTVELGDGRYAAILEAANTDYPRMLLSPVRGSKGTLVSDLGGAVHGNAPYATPWRLVLTGERPGDLVEHNYLVLNLNPPSELKDASWIRPGKVIREVTLSTKGGRECVDFAARHGLQYVEYDAGWYGYENEEQSDATRVALDPRRVSSIPDHGGLDLQEVIRYARSKGIGVFVYVNRRALERQLDVILPLYRSWGVAGVKFGFVNAGPQEWTAWLHDAVRKAAGNRLLIDIHDQYRPGGVTRTYPNLLTQEGVRGNEHMPTATHNATLPFTRFLAGPADYTICYYTDRIKTTRAHQLALAAAFYSPLQFLYWYDKPSAFGGEPETEFFDRVPTVWDDTRVMDGRIGEFAAIARRSGEEWYTGTIAGDAPREVELRLSFLSAGKKYTAHIYENGAGKNDVRMSRRSVDAATVIRVALPAAGGHAMRLVPE